MLLETEARLTMTPLFVSTLLFVITVVESPLLLLTTVLEVDLTELDELILALLSPFFGFSLSKIES